nr:hypothetical protein Iba_chr15cCG7110 [Ipomoea batatas]
MKEFDSLHYHRGKFDRLGPRDIGVRWTYARGGVFPPRDSLNWHPESEPVGWMDIIDVSDSDTEENPVKSTDKGKSSVVVFVKQKPIDYDDIVCDNPIVTALIILLKTT